VVSFTIPKIFGLALTFELGGFTVKELEQIGCWDKPNVKASNLHTEVPIHELFREDRWASTNNPLYKPYHTRILPIGGGYEGNWEFSNGIVRKALDPSIRLASKVISHIHTWPWYVICILTGYHKLTRSRFDALLLNHPW
jgi:hypothetical protein